MTENHGVEPRQDFTEEQIRTAFEVLCALPDLMPRYVSHLDLNNARVAMLKLHDKILQTESERTFRDRTLELVEEWESRDNRAARAAAVELRKVLDGRS